LYRLELVYYIVSANVLVNVFVLADDLLHNLVSLGPLALLCASVNHDEGFHILLLVIRKH